VASSYTPGIFRETHMRKLQAVGLVLLGVIFGAGAVSFGSQADAQSRTVQSMEELNQRFVVGNEERTRKGPYLYWFQFIKDTKTGDCYIRNTSAENYTLTKTDDDACTGL
jgi:hypothetical protein